MQTFLPYPSFAMSASVLDRQRLGKQRVEAWQILQALNGQSKGWINHPAVKMWRGYEDALNYYGHVICCEWRKRGYKDRMMERFALLPRVKYPPWFGQNDFHAAHRSNLLRKNPEWYSRFGWSEPDNLPYVWPAR